MRIVRSITMAATAVLPHVLAISPAYGEDAVTRALTSGEAHLNARLRHEEVAVDSNANEDAKALTLRTRAGYTTASVEGFTGMIEFEDVRTVAGTDEYAPVQTGFSTIADPPITELNQSWVNYENEAGFSARYGRQRVILDNARFIGNVGWRQDEQTYDGLRAGYENEQINATLAGITQVNSIRPAFDANTSDTLANLKWKSAPGGSLTGYGYLLENDTTGRELDTMGARYTGEQDLAELALLYSLEYATQERSQPNTASREANYQLLSAGLRSQGVTLKINQERLGSDNGNYGFQTPRATKHAFNGWADQFLLTPATGLNDQFVSLGGAVAGIEIKAVYHRFSATETSTDYGTETDLVATRSFGDHYELGLKYAGYSADSRGSDTDKYWAWGSFQF